MEKVKSQLIKMFQEIQEAVQLVTITEVESLPPGEHITPVIYLLTPHGLERAKVFEIGGEEMGEAEKIKLRKKILTKLLYQSHAYGYFFAVEAKRYAPSDPQAIAKMLAGDLKQADIPPDDLDETVIVYVVAQGAGVSHLAPVTTGVDQKRHVGAFEPSLIPVETGGISAMPLEW